MDRATRSSGSRQRTLRYVVKVFCELDPSVDHSVIFPDVTAAVDKVLGRLFFSRGQEERAGLSVVTDAKRITSAALCLLSVEPICL